MAFIEIFLSDARDGADLQTRSAAGVLLAKVLIGHAAKRESGIRSKVGNGFHFSHFFIDNRTYPVYS
jgi:hypothetical protein